MFEQFSRYVERIVDEADQDASVEWFNLCRFRQQGGVDGGNVGVEVGFPP
ncbi:hypothetical protein ACIRRA_33755 [Nocardia sp. NPDC101769]